MKKIFPIILIVVLIFTLVGCTSNKTTTGSSNESSTQQKNETNTSDENTQTKTEENNNKKQSDNGTKKILVAYFSYSGNTRTIANEIHEKVGGDIFEIKTVEPYPTDYNAVVDQAKKEQEENYRPKLESKVDNMGSYDVIFIGYPNWWNTVPMPVFTFMEEYDFAGKTIIPFCTHGGGGFAHGVDDMKSTLSSAKFMNGLAIRDSNVKNAQDEVTQWLDALDISK